MGVQCNIILTFYSEQFCEENRAIRTIEEVQIKRILGVHLNVKTVIDPIGNRQWGPGDLTTMAICVKDWFDEECEKFFDQIAQVNWQFPDSVQLYYCPAHYENFELFRYRLLMKP